MGRGCYRRRTSTLKAPAAPRSTKSCHRRCRRILLAKPMSGILIINFGLQRVRVIKPNLVLTEVYFLTLFPMDTEAQALIQILKSILDHRT